MTLPMIITAIAICCAAVFGILMSQFAFQMVKAKKSLKQKLKESQAQHAQLTILESIQREIDYSLDTEKIVAILSKSIADIIPSTTFTTLVLHDEKIVCNTVLQDKVSKGFIDKVHQSMLQSLKEITQYPLPSNIESTTKGTLLEYTNDTETLASLCHIPLVISNRVVGCITLASSIANYYSYDDMMLLYRTMQQATTTITKLREVIGTEKRRLTSLITSLHDGIIMIDENDVLQVINNSAKDILKIHSESPTMFDLLQTLAKSYPIDEKIQEAKLKNKPIHEKEIIIGEKTITIDITPVIASFTNETTKEVTTKIIGISIVLHDITIEKSLNQLKDDFTNEIVHELRSPLTAIKASAMLIATDKTIPPDEAKMIDIIIHQSERMLGDITSLLDAAKMETGKFSVSQKPTDVTKLVTDSVTLFKTAVNNKKVELISQIGDNLPQGMIDSNRITQVINNLISNSLKFTPENGKITVSASYHYNEHLPTTRTNPGILISVSDTGIGIAKEKQGLLFSKFGQVKNDKFVPKESGTGLGLYVSKGIVEAHGGSMYLESEEGKGTTISFTVPIAPEKVIAQMTTAKQILQPNAQTGMQVIAGVH